jgi:hypothetical protein
MKTIILFLICFSSTNIFAEEVAPKIDSVITACVQSVKKDKICEALTEFKQVGDDAIEAIKVYIHLTPREYFLLTVANMIASNRIRFKSKSHLYEGGTDTIDIKKDHIDFIFEMSF